MRKPKNNLLRAIQRSAITQSDNPGGNHISRRSFLSAATKAGLLVAASSYIPFLSSCNTKLKPKVVIVGAGIAGLTAAYYLKKICADGIDLSIYDSLKRTGGRIHTDATFMPGLTMEVGGEFIDDDHFEMKRLVKEFNLELKDNHADNLNPEGNSDWYFIGNKRYTEEEVIKEFSNYTAILKSDQKAVGENYDTPDAKKLDQISLEEYFDRIQLSGWLRSLLDVAYMSEFGTATGEQSSLNFLSMINPDTGGGFKIFGASNERYSIKGGNAKLTDTLAAKVAPINLDHHLEAVKSKGTGFTLTFNGNKDVDADYVIMTVPFKILREVKLDIEMPAQKRKAINELGYGNNAKLFLSFNERIWRTKYKVPGYCFNETIHNAWDNSWMQNNNEGPGGFTIFLGGKEAVSLAENRKNKQAMAEKYLPALDQVYPSIKSQWGGQAEIAWWPLSKAIKGSYAAYTVGQWTSIAGHEIEPIGNMLFAGEHCNTDYQGFMNGGAETGRMAATKLVQVLNGRV